MDYRLAIEIVKSQRHYFTNRSQFVVEEKSRANYVTSIDKEIETNIKSALAVSYPTIDFVGEEQADNKSSPSYWLLDPIDGTQNYIKRQYPSMISLALVENDEVVFALIYDPYFDDIYHAYKGKGTFCNERRVSVSNSEMKQSIVMLGTSPYSRELSQVTFNLAHNIFSHTNDIRRSGSACYDLVQVACGRADAYLELVVQSWDFAAGYLLVKEAGGEVTDIDGKSLLKMKIGKTSIVASNGKIHHDLIKLTSRAYE